mgnify:CR=1 FL=1
MSLERISWKLGNAPVAFSSRWRGRYHEMTLWSCGNRIRTTRSSLALRCGVTKEGGACEALAHAILLLSDREEPTFSQDTGILHEGLPAHEDTEEIMDKVIKPGEWVKCEHCLNSHLVETMGGRKVYWCHATARYYKLPLHTFRT